MGDLSKFFEARGVTNESRIEIPYAPWLMWDQPMEQSFRANPFPEGGELRYEGWIRIVPAIGAAPRITDPTSPDVLKLGDSWVALTPGYDFKFQVVAEGEVREVLAMRNAHDRLAYLRLEDISASSLATAVNVARVAANSLSWAVNFAHHAPLSYDAIFVRRVDLAEGSMLVNAPIPIAPLSQPDEVWMFPAMKPFISLYAEGIRSQSPFYRFLCFFKICQRINSRVRAQFRKMFIRKGLPPPPLNGTFPGDPIAYAARDRVGTKYSAAITDYQAQYRNAIAHFDPSDRLEPFDLSAEGAARTASILMNWAAFDLLTQMIDAIKQLRAEGVADNEIVFG